MNRYPEGEPCWAPGAADYLASILTGNEIAWEWGGGASSVWLAPQVDYLHVMESHQGWANWLNDMLPLDCRLHFRKFEDSSYVEYAGTVHPMPTLWLIDGFKRIDCLKLVESRVHEGDLVVLDDALDYAEHLLVVENDIKRFAMPHPHAGLSCVSEKNTRHRNTVRKTAPATKETWIWRV